MAVKTGTEVCFVWHVPEKFLGLERRHSCSPSVSLTISSASSIRSSFVLPDSSATLLSMSSLICVTIFVEKMSGRSETRQFSMTRWMTLSVNVFRLACIGTVLAS